MKTQFRAKIHTSAMITSHSKGHLFLITEVQYELLGEFNQVITQLELTIIICVLVILILVLRRLKWRIKSSRSMPAVITLVFNPSTCSSLGYYIRPYLKTKRHTKIVLMYTNFES